MSADMNEMIRARRGRTVADVEPENETPALQPTFGKAGGWVDLTRRPANTNDRLRSMFDNRPRARGAYRVGSGQ